MVRQKDIKSVKDSPKQAVRKSLLGQVSSAMPSQMPFSTLSRQNCFVQREQGFDSLVGNSKMVLLDPQKHLQKVTGLAAKQPMTKYCKSIGNSHRGTIERKDQLWSCKVKRHECLCQLRNVSKCKLYALLCHARYCSIRNTSGSHGHIRYGKGFPLLTDSRASVMLEFDMLCLLLYLHTLSKR